MKRIILAAAITALFSTMANADSGLADRINEARSYPNKIVESSDMRTLTTQHQQIDIKESKVELRDHQESSS